jgi:hypothetical protein
MHRLTLPAEGRRAFVRAWWLALAAASLGGGAALSVAAGTSFVSALTIGMVAAALVAAVPLMFDSFARRAYYAWNARIVRPVARVVAAAALRICFFIVIAAVGRVGANAGSTAPGRWSPRRSLGRDAYRGPSADVDRGNAGRGWLSEYVRWGRATQNAWSLSLLPFLALMRVLPSEDEASPAPGIYTLF